MKKPLISVIIIDYKDKNPYLVENLNALQKQSFEDFEIILVTDQKNNLKYPKLVKKHFGHYVGPAEKRDYGAKVAKGDILAFIDDDAYPSPNWLKSMVSVFRDPEVVGVGGPGVTPPNVSWAEEASGWASASPLGSGIYLYRFLPRSRRGVDDFPSMNLAVRKKDFLEVGGFDSNYWPGEDTKLCLDLVTKTKKVIVYDPQVLVFHHRRPVFKAHLRQCGNFGLHRGYFVRALPKTSLKLIYFLPSLLSIYLSLLPFFGNYPYFIFPLSLYIFTLLLNSIWVFHTSRRLLQSLISIPVVFITHFWYGLRFLQGLFFTAKLKQ